MPEYSVTNEFCRKHFLIGILLREVGFALQEDQDIRHLALAVLKNLMAKHSFDDRYREPVSDLSASYPQHPLMAHGINCISDLSAYWSLCESFLPLPFHLEKAGPDSRSVHAPVRHAAGQHAKDLLEGSVSLYCQYIQSGKRVFGFTFQWGFCWFFVCSEC